MLALVLGVWVAVLAGMALFARPGDALAVVTWPGRGLDVVMQAEGSIESHGGTLILTRSKQPDFVARLYRAGALLVIDSRVVIACRNFVGKAAD